MIGTPADPHLRCWHCSGQINMLEDGWICRSCCQHGPLFDTPAKDWEEGCVGNKPYATISTGRDDHSDVKSTSTATGSAG